MPVGPKGEKRSVAEKAPTPRGDPVCPSTHIAMRPLRQKSSRFRKAGHVRDVSAFVGRLWNSQMPS